MTINANIGSNYLQSVKNGAATAVKGDVAEASVKASSLPSFGGMTVSEGVGDSVDILAARLTADDLSRDDSLGKLVFTAFNLPPPAMPDFR